MESDVDGIECLIHPEDYKAGLVERVWEREEESHKTHNVSSAAICG